MQISTLAKMNNHHMISLLYFLEEALGFREGLHWLRLYLESGSQHDLEKLAVTVCREKLFDYESWNSLTDGHRIKLPLHIAIEQIRSQIESNNLLNALVNQDHFTQALGRYFAGKSWLIDRLVKGIEAAPFANWRDALSRNQIKSKLWLLENMCKNNWLGEDTKLLLVGGWVGILPLLISAQGYKVNTITNVDLDPTVHAPAEILNGSSDFQFVTMKEDIRTLDIASYAYKDYIIVDTIVEHFENHGAWLKSLPKGTKVVLQGNDMFGIADHVNCHNDLDEFVTSCDIPKIHYQGFKELQDCTRFMLLGET